MKVSILLLSVLVIFAVISITEAKKKKKDAEAGPCTVKNCTKCNVSGKKCKQCDDGFKEKKKGKKCVAKPCFVNPCKNGGECVAKKKKEKCVCKEPFFGDFCEIGEPDVLPVEETPCDPNPCNAGECSMGGSALGFTCKCPKGSTGETCDQAVVLPAVLPVDPLPEPEIPEEETPCDPNPCNEGECSMGGSALGFTCKCPPGSSGETCEEDAVLPPAPAPVKPAPAATAVCPSSHPYVYHDGDYCCKNNVEENDCGGAAISLTSRCCKDQAYTKCATSVCSDYKAPVEDEFVLAKANTEPGASGCRHLGTYRGQTGVDACKTLCRDRAQCDTMNYCPEAGKGCGLGECNLKSCNGGEAGGDTKIGSGGYKGWAVWTKA